MKLLQIFKRVVKGSILYEVIVSSDQDCYLLGTPYLEILEQASKQLGTGRGWCKSLDGLDKRLELTLLNSFGMLSKHILNFDRECLALKIQNVLVYERDWERDLSRTKKEWQPILNFKMSTLYFVNTLYVVWKYSWNWFCNGLNFLSS